MNRLYKTKPCKSKAMTGECSYGDKCMFAHSKDELNVIYCNYGDDCGNEMCIFYHDLYGMDDYIKRWTSDEQKYYNKLCKVCNDEVKLVGRKLSIDISGLKNNKIVKDEESKLLSKKWKDVVSVATSPITESWGDSCPNTPLDIDKELNILKKRNEEDGPWSIKTSKKSKIKKGKKINEKKIYNSKIKKKTDIKESKISKILKSNVKKCVNTNIFVNKKRTCKIEINCTYTDKNKKLMDDFFMTFVNKGDDIVYFKYKVE